jgi:hypothetical protein
MVLVSEPHKTSSLFFTRKFGLRRHLIRSGNEVMFTSTSECCPCLPNLGASRSCCSSFAAETKTRYLDSFLFSMMRCDALLPTTCEKNVPTPFRPPLWSIKSIHGDRYITLTVSNGQFDPAALMSSIAEQVGRQWRGFTEVSRGETSLSGQRGTSNVYTGTNPRGVEASPQLVSAVVGGNTFVFLLSGPKAEFESIEGAFVQMRRSFAVSGAATQSAPGNEPIKPVPLTVTRVGDFMLGLPQGWSVTASPGGDVVQMRSRGTEQPSVYVMVTSVSDLRFEASLNACSKHPVNLSYDIFSQCTVPSVRTQLNDSSQEWDQQTAFPLILQRLSGGAAQFGNPILTPTSASRAFYRVAATSRIGKLENWGIITMVYVPNPMLGPGKVTSLAMILGCTAPSDEADGFRATCSSVIDSFRADANAHEQQSPSSKRARSIRYVVTDLSHLTSCGPRRFHHPLSRTRPSP